MKYDSKPCKLLSARQLTGDVFDFVLSDDDMAAISAMDTGKRNSADPDNFDF